MIRRLSNAVLPVLVMLATPSLHAQPVRLIEDVRPGPLGCFQRDDGSLNDFTTPAVAGGYFFFACDDGVHGIELWKSDGTAEGTSMVKDIRPGSGNAFPESKSDPTWFSQDLVAVGEAVFFVANDGVHGYGLWKSDGSREGTILVGDLCPGSCHSLPRQLEGVDGLLYFAADDVFHGLEPWRSDGTADGTFMLADLNPGDGDSNPAEFTGFASSVFFFAEGGLWQTDGTASGTGFVHAQGGRELTAAGGSMFFGYDTQLWTTDGTAAGTVVVRDICDGTCGGCNRVEGLTALGTEVFFIGGDGIWSPCHGTELWKSDGTYSGTSMVKDIWPGEGDGWPLNSTVLEDTLFFTATSPDQSEWDGPGCSELWKSDGTESGTTLVKDIWPYDPNELFCIAAPDFLEPHGGLLYFRHSDGLHGDELWRSNGRTHGTVMLEDILEGSDSAYPRWLTSAGLDLFFVAYDSVHGFEPWILPRSTTLHDQTGEAASSGQASQEFEPADSSYDCLAADDFVVPAADRQWDLGEVVVGGAYDPGGGPTPFLNLEVYADSSGLPGATVCSYDGLAAGVDFTDHTGDLKIVLPTPCTLPSGTYWLMVQADMDFAIGSQWWWTQRTLQWLTPYRWTNPEDGFGSGCTTWAAGCGGSEPDLAFVLRTSPGCALGASDLVLAGETLSGTARIEACRTITAGGGTAVATGSDVTLRAGRRIVLESGFSVDAGTSLELEIDPGLASPDP